jgi:hypothetical protein
VLARTVPGVATVHLDPDAAPEPDGIPVTSGRLAP